MFGKKLNAFEMQEYTWWQGDLNKNEVKLDQSEIKSMGGVCVGHWDFVFVSQR